MTSSSNGFDPSLTGSADNGIFGLATTAETSALVYIPVPWEVTTSYGSGTASGPATIRQASPQLDLYQRGMADHYSRGFHLLAENDEIRQLNSRYKPLATEIQEVLENEGSLAARDDLVQERRRVNEAGARVNELVYEEARHWHQQGRQVALIGGDHSSPLGLIHYLADHYRGQFGVLHVDAHHDLRHAYQGFQYSHASIMRNVMALDCRPAALVQVGIRDFCEEEAEFARQESAVHTFYDQDVKERLFGGETFAGVVAEIVDRLPRKVYISFDIDGLQPDLCTHTGTPVAGGLSFEQALYLIKQVAISGRTIVGFDLCEVAPDPSDAANEWDGNVGARILFALSSWMMESRA